MVDWISLTIIGRMYSMHDEMSLVGNLRGKRSLGHLVIDRRVT